MGMTATDNSAADGIHGMVPRDSMPEHIQKLRDAYNIVPGAPFYQMEFGYYCLERWQEQGMPEDADFGELFGYDPGASYSLGGLGWCGNE